MTVIQMTPQTTEDVSGQSADLDGRAVAAMLSKDEMERLIEDFKPFLLSRVSRYAAHADESRRDEMFGSAMLAFYESVQKYDGSKGHFFPFANKIVCERLIDYNRKEYKRGGFEVSLDENEEDGEQSAAQSAALRDVSMRAYEETLAQSQLVDEIEQFRAELAAWGITMASLASQSPKHKRVREEYRLVVSRVVTDPDIIQTIQLKHYFPVKAVSIISGLPQKKVERARNYILASIIIMTGDYDYLSEYVNG